MKVSLGPSDACPIYQFWSEWLKSDSPTSVLPLIGMEPVKYFNATAANRYRFGLKSNYLAYPISWEERNNYLDDIYEINTSLSERQGRPMRENYVERPSVSRETLICSDHHAKFIGCFKDGKLIAYISANFCGDLAASSQIIGHGEHLKNGCMLVLWGEFIRLCQEKIIRIIVYSRWSDGTDGLRYWKHSVGMVPRIVKEM